MIEACEGLPGEVAVAEVVPTRCVLDTRVPVSDYQKTVKKEKHFEAYCYEVDEPTEG